jgi:NDP-sugar pyrophosphorylase family protein
MFLLDELFNLSEFTFKEIFAGIEYPWDVLRIISKFIDGSGLNGVNSSVPEGAHIIGEPVYIGKNCRIEPNTYIEAPAIIWDGVQIRSGAYIRGSVIVDSGTVVGHSTEVKNSILMRNVEAPHFNYVGDSVMGNRSHTGAGVILSNFKISEDKCVKVKIGGDVYDTGLDKFGALVGDDVQIGCNCILSPGTIIGKSTMIYALSLISGYIPPDKIVKNKPEYIQVDKKK